MNKKSFLLSLLTTMMVAMLSFGFGSCGGDDDDNDDPNNGQPVNPSTTVNDPEGTVSLSMRNADNGKTYLDNIYIKNENFVGASFVSVGAVKGLGNVSTIPTAGWADQVSVIAGNGYIAYSNDKFYRIYVVDDIVATTGGIIGADIKYQKPFKGVDEAISLDEKSLTFGNNGGSQSLVFNNKNIVLFSASSNPIWCRVKKSSTYDKYFLYNAVTISVDEKSTPDTDNAIVTLTTAYDKKVEIKVTRLGPDPILELAEKESNITGAEQTFNVGITTNYPLEDLELNNTNDWLRAEIVNGTRSMQARAANIRFVGEQEQQSTRGGSNTGNASSYYIRLIATTNYAESIRTGSVKLSVKGSQKTQTLSVKQDGAFIKTDKSEVNFNKAASNGQCSFTSSIKSEELNVRSSEAWCKTTKKQNSVTISVDNNVTGLERSAIVTIYSNKSTVSADIKVTQTSGGIKFADDEITIPATSSTKTVSVTSDFSKDEMTISSNANWCVPSVTNAQSVSMACEENPTEKARTANVTISDLSGNRKDVLIVNQEAGYIRLQEGTITLTGTEETNTGTLTFTSNVVDANLEVSSKASWCTPTISRGTITFSAVSNPTEEDRSTTVTIKAKKGTLSKNIKVIQSANRIEVNGSKDDCVEIYFDRNSANSTISINTTLPNIEPVISDAWCTITYNKYNNRGGSLVLRLESTSSNRYTTIRFNGYKETVILKQCKYALGDNYNENGLSGLVCYLVNNEGKISRDLGINAVWSTENELTYADNMDDGMTNMEKIKRIPNWENLYPVFAKCNELNVSGESGWYVPAYNEIYYESIIPGTYYNYKNYYTPYWTSTEYGRNQCYAVRRNSGTYSYQTFYNYENKLMSCRIVVMHKFSINY